MWNCRWTLLDIEKETSEITTKQTSTHSIEEHCLRYTGDQRCGNVCCGCQPLALKSLTQLDKETRSLKHLKAMRKSM